jgi:protein O-GlcNAc transferase
MSTDPRVALALKYQHAGLVAEAWHSISDLVTDPDAPDSVLELGLTLRQAAHAFADIVAIANRLLQRHPTRAGIWALLADAQEHLGQPLAAIVAYEKAIDCAPANALYGGNLAALYMGQGRFAAAVRQLRQVLDAAPDNVPALINFAVCEIECGRIHQGLAALMRAQEIDPANAAAYDNALFALHNVATTAAELFDAHVNWGRTQQTKNTLWPTVATANRKLRIGYVSPDFRQHSVAYFVEPLLRAHDRAQYDVYCYSNAVHGDDVTQHFRSLADGWRDIGGLATDQVADLIRQDAVDVLVDLAGHTQGHRLDVFAARPAKIQITAIGYPGTTGASFFDGRLVDAWSDPPEFDAMSSEPVLRVPGGMHCYAPPMRAPDVAPLPHQSGAPLTFGSFNKLAKVTDQTLRLWAQVLDAVPKSRLLIKSKALSEAETRAALTARCNSAGIATTRLDLRGWSPDDKDHLRLYGSVDMALDTTPYNGTTTTCEALWMGVPVISLVGQTHAARVGLSLLSNAGLSNFACTTIHDFIATAKSWSENLPALQNLRRSMRTRVAQSRLCNQLAYTREVETIYRRLCDAR